MLFDTTHSPFQKFETLDFTLDNWLIHWYPAICDYLGISQASDYLSLKKILFTYSSSIQNQTLEKIINQKVVIIFAPGPSLSNNSIQKVHAQKNEESLLISVDGATSFLVLNRIFPSIVVTDLDGKVEDQIKAQQKGSILLCHVHGDNMETVTKYLPIIQEGKFALTTQILPLPGSYNFLGFTDGDRAVCLATYFKAKKIYLVGFDFGEKVGKFSKPTLLNDQKRVKKMKKFVIAKSLINWCSLNIEIEML
ncbi:MAG: 6-hydroxymethylpterin diphosphokinase MptE-like protein [Candidatus Heimdallarchaeaceae archaeon]